MSKQKVWTVEFVEHKTPILTEQELEVVKETKDLIYYEYTAESSERVYSKFIRKNTKYSFSSMIEVEAHVFYEEKLKIRQSALLRSIDLATQEVQKISQILDTL